MKINTLLKRFFKTHHTKSMTPAERKAWHEKMQKIKDARASEKLALAKAAQEKAEAKTLKDQEKEGREEEIDDLKHDARKLGYEAAIARAEKRISDLEYDDDYGPPEQSGNIEDDLFGGLIENVSKGFFNKKGKGKARSDRRSDHVDTDEDTSDPDGDLESIGPDQ